MYLVLKRHKVLKEATHAIESVTHDPDEALKAAGKERFVVYVMPEDMLKLLSLFKLKHGGIEIF
jgi:hypothetical protein